MSVSLAFPRFQSVLDTVTIVAVEGKAPYKLTQLAELKLVTIAYFPDPNVPLRKVPALALAASSNLIVDRLIEPPLELKTSNHSLLEVPPEGLLIISEITSPACPVAGKHKYATHANRNAKHLDMMHSDQEPLSQQN